MEILSLGEKIKKLRKEKEMTLKELAGDRITAAQISHIERDKSHTSYELLEYISKRLEVNIEYLLETKEMQSKKITDNLILKSEIHIKSQELEEAFVCINKAMYICEEYHLDDNYGKCNFLLASINLEKNQNNEAILNFEKALYFFIKQEDYEYIFNCYLNIGKVYINQEFYDPAISHLEFAMGVLDKTNLEDISIRKDIYSCMAYCYINIGDSEKSLDYISKIEEIDKHNNSKEEVDLLLLKGNNLLKIRNYEEAKECFKKTLEILEKENSKNKVASIYLTIGEIYKNIGCLDKVLEYSEKAYEIKKYDDDKNMSESLFKIVEVYIERANYELAKKYCKLALANSIKTKNKLNEYKSLYLYSKIYQLKKEEDVAIEYLLKCINIINELEDNKILAKLYIELATLHSNISKEKELEFYQKGILLYKQLEII